LDRGFCENEVADAGAKEEFRLTALNYITYIERKEMIGKIKQYVTDKW